MIFQSINSFRSEWLKTKLSAAWWLTLTGSFLIPVIFIVNRIVDFDSLYPSSKSERFWEGLFFHSWNITNIMVLPLGVILSTSLVAQLEYRNNTWKQLHTTPQSISQIFFIKLSVILMMLLQFFILFNLGIYLSGMVPNLVFRGIPFPEETIPFKLFLKKNLNFFIDCLPILALQYLVSIQFRNFLIPLGLGLGLYISSMVAVSWKYGYIIPYTYSLLNAMDKQSPIDPKINLHLWAAGYFIVITVCSYILFITKKQKG